MYEPSWDSVATHPLPDWYDDAKLGIFVHWGLYSVPGWAPQVPDIQQLLREKGPAEMLRDNPYAEWYLNSSRLRGSPTWHHQRVTYGPDATYDDFVAVLDFPIYARYLLLARYFRSFVPRSNDLAPREPFLQLFLFMEQQQAVRTY